MWAHVVEVASQQRAGRSVRLEGRVCDRRKERSDYIGEWEPFCAWGFLMLRSNGEPWQVLEQGRDRDPVQAFCGNSTSADGSRMELSGCRGGRRAT